MKHVHTFGTEPTLTDEPHLLPYEQAARIYCARLNVDPDGVSEVPHPSGLVGAPPVFRPAWCYAADKLIDLSHMLGALREAAASDKVQ